ncbi:MAG TPA: hypothetical protein VGB83_06285 [Actinomycetota bacterium]
MRRIALLTIGLAVALSSCSTGKDIGGELGDVDSSINPTNTATETPDDKPRKRKTKTPTPTETPKSSYKPVVYTIVVFRDGLQDFEWKGGSQKEYIPADQGPRVFVGDVIIFKNLDDRFSPTEHSFTSGTATQSPGKVFDSGMIEPGKQWRWVVDAAPGQYTYFDRVVNFADGGPLDVVENPAL